MKSSASSLGPDLVRALPSSVAPEPVRLVLTIEECADRMGIGKSLMYALVSSGAVESVRIGRLRRVPTEALSEFVAHLRANQNGAA